MLAIGGAHLLSLPRSRAGSVGTAKRDRVPEMPPRRLVASALICPIVKLPVRSLRRRHLHPCHLPSKSEPARCRVLHDFTPAPRDRLPALLLPICANGRQPASVFRRAARGSSPFTGELLATIHAIVASSLSLLRVTLLTTASRRGPWIHHLATFRAKRYRRISTPVIQVRTPTLRDEPPSPLR